MDSVDMPVVIPSGIVEATGIGRREKAELAALLGSRHRLLRRLSHST